MGISLFNEMFPWRLKCLWWLFDHTMHVGETVNMVTIGQYCDTPEDMPGLSNKAQESHSAICTRLCSDGDADML
jgi:hypothetical protein